jgi:integrase
VRDWLAVRGAAPGPLLQPVRKGGGVQDRPLSAHAVRDLCRELARLAATEPFAPHDLRRTWTGDLLDASGGLAIVQQLAGHATPTTTARYDRRPEATRRRAAELLHVPYVAPHPAPAVRSPAPTPRRRIASRFARAMLGKGTDV